MQPFGDRSKVVIEPMLTDQWFVDTGKIVGPAIDAVRSGEVRILPEQHGKVYFNWLENIEPWCISRQLWWGHRIPVWYAPELGNEGIGEWRAFAAASEEAAFAAMTEHYGHANFRAVETAAEAKELLSASIGDLTSGASQAAAPVTIPVYRDADVLDTWFSSGLWPLGTLGWTGDAEADAQNEILQTYFPTSVLITGFDIIFFWVARMMMMQYAVVGQKPFGDVYVHALVRDEKGKKMSKSLGNVLDPLDLIDEFGADAVRFTLSSMAAMGRDLKLSRDRIAGYRNFGTKLWNAVRFAEMNGVYEPRAGVRHKADTKPTQGRRLPEASQTANRWILGETARACAEVDAALAAYRFNDASAALYGFVWGRVCDWYVEFAKPLFASEDPAIVEETRAVMAWVLDRCLILLHPFMPFVTEELWALTAPPEGRATMLVHAPWPTEQAADIADEMADAEMGWVIVLIDEIRSLRAQMHVPAGARLPLLQLDLDAAGGATLASSLPLIQRLARINSVSEVNALPRDALTVAVPGGTFGLPIADAIDIAEEQAQLDKTLQKSEKELKGLRGRLSNEAFVASAPSEVVEETRERLGQGEAEAARLRAALDRLKEMA